MNHLSSETSPYLLQHADNPVDWYAWSEVALQKARDENKPILLSIGYSACHWCHVMAHESFEDPATAAVMNKLFINIKVDREERPDLDKIYQSAFQLMNQRGGGWPLTMVLTPDQHIPFFAGTYLPPKPRYNMPSFTDLMTQIAEFYSANKDSINQQNQAIVQSLGRMDNPNELPTDSLNNTPLKAAREQLERHYEPTYAGFGSAPKFPHPNNIERLMRHWSASVSAANEDRRARHMAITSLRKMALGGIFDHLGGGFCRYSTDDRWMIPHFEKMLYDNGPLLSLYSQGWLATGDSLFQRTAEETAEWVMREMQSAEGGYYSSLDADSQGEEGKFYIWSPEAVRSLIGEEDFPLFARRFGLDRPANFEGNWHLHTYHELEELAEEFNSDVDSLRDQINPVRRLLYLAREDRIHPGRDEKILTSWNALMIRGMAAAARALNDRRYIFSANRALDFIQNTLWQNGRLLATYKDGKAHLNAYLDDYAYTIAAILDLLEARWNTAHLRFAMTLADALLDKFEDPAGGFFFTSNDHETLIHRPKPMADDAIPSGNGMAALSLNRLGHLVGEPRYTEAAENTLKNAWAAIKNAPYAHNTLLDALDEIIEPGEMIIVRGKEADFAPWRKKFNSEYQPKRLSFLIPDSETDLPGLLGERKAGATPLAYVCRGVQCYPPISNLDQLSNL